MASEDLQLRYARLYLARVYPADNPGQLDALKKLADVVHSEATDTVTLTSSSFEGGQGSGVLNFQKVILALAIEERIAAIDPDYIAPREQALGTVQRFSPL